MSQSRPSTGADLLPEAERLIRSLTGVVDARVHPSSDTGIDAIHVEVCDPEHADAIAGHVRSALLAGLATPVTPARIHVRVAAGASTPPVTPARDRDARHRLRLVEDSDEQSPGSPTEPEPPHEAPLTARPRLVATDLHRSDDGRVLCNVTVAYGTDVHNADAVAVDLPGAAAQAAAQATVRALSNAGIDNLELDGLREIEIAGRDYVLVALRRAGHYTRVRSGSAPITGAPERAAALATVDAARQLT